MSRIHDIRNPTTDVSVDGFHAAIPVTAFDGSIRSFQQAGGHPMRAGWWVKQYTDSPNPPATPNENVFSIGFGFRAPLGSDLSVLTISFWMRSRNHTDGSHQYRWRSSYVSSLAPNPAFEDRRWSNATPIPFAPGLPPVHPGALYTSDNLASLVLPATSAADAELEALPGYAEIWIILEHISPNFPTVVRNTNEIFQPDNFPGEYVTIVTTP